MTSTVRSVLLLLSFSCDPTQATSLLPSRISQHISNKAYQQLPRLGKKGLVRFLLTVHHPIYLSPRVEPPKTPNPQSYGHHSIYLFCLPTYQLTGTTINFARRLCRPAEGPNLSTSLLTDISVSWKLDFNPYTDSGPE